MRIKGAVARLRNCGGGLPIARMVAPTHAHDHVHFLTHHTAEAERLRLRLEARDALGWIDIDIIEFVNGGAVPDGEPKALKRKWMDRGQDRRARPISRMRPFPFLALRLKRSRLRRLGCGE